MMGFNGFSGLSMGWPLHAFFGLVLFTGVIFLIIWAIKMLDKKDLGMWTLILLLVGILGMFLTSLFGFRGGYYMMRGFDKDNFWENVKDEIREDAPDEIDTDEEWNDYMFEQMREHMGLTIE